VKVTVNGPSTESSIEHGVRQFEPSDVKWWWRALIVFVLTGTITGILSLSNPETLGGEPRWFDTSPFREFILFTLVLLGMIARVVSVAIESQLLSQVRGETLVLTDVVLAFQTGFFWQTILKRAVT